MAGTSPAMTVNLHHSRSVKVAFVASSHERDARLRAMPPDKPRMSAFALAGDQKIEFGGKRHSFSDRDLGAFAGAVANEAVCGGILVVERNQAIEKGPVARSLAALFHRCPLLTQLADSPARRAWIGPGPGANGEWRVANSHSIRHLLFAKKVK